MQLIVRKSRLSGEAAMPTSKSHTIRAVAIASLANGTSTIANPLVSSDTMAAVQCYRALGADIDASDSRLWRVRGTSGGIKPVAGIVDVGNSGTTLRLGMGSAALAPQGQSTTFTGDEQVRNRTVAPLMKALTELGARCFSLHDNGKAPVQVSGRLKGGKTSIAATTSQFLSSLLLCSPLAEKDTEIEVTVLNEPGYVQMTLDWLDKQGIEYDHQGFTKFDVRGRQVYEAFESGITGDFSSATFFLCGAALVGDKVRLSGLDMSDSQPDKAVVDYLKKMGADITVGSDSITVRADRLKGTEIDMNRTPDALPAMAVTAAFAEGRTKLLNVAQARGKETDRIRCMAEELTRMQVQVEELPDGLVIKGGQPRAGSFSGRGDHRIVMALSLAALAAEYSSVIDTAEAINVTFPDYVNLMRNLGANMELKD